MLDEKVIQDFMKDTSNYYKYIVSGKKGTCQKIQPHVNVRVSTSEQFGRHRQQFLFADILYKLKRNTHNEKIDVTVQLNLDIRKFQYFMNGEATSAEVAQRARFVSALAMVAQFPDTTMAVYYKRQTAKDRVFQIKQAPVCEWLQGRMVFTGDYKQDYEAAWMQLWFNLSAKLTEHDDTIKRISLSHYKQLIFAETFR